MKPGSKETGMAGQGPGEELPQFSYRAYGLTLCSELRFPELNTSEASPELQVQVQVRLGRVEPKPKPEELDQNGCGFWCQGDQACHYYRGAAAYLVTGGREILVDPDQGAEESLLRLGVLGPAMALLQEQLGRLVFHASAVEFDGRVVAFTGGHSCGKSTMAASQHVLGQALVTDDVTAVELPGGELGKGERQGEGQVQAQVLVVPSFPQLKLWPDAAERLGLEAEAMPLVHPEHTKRAYRPIECCQESLLPLARLYVLGVGEKVEIRDLEPLEGSRFVMANWYGARFGPAYIRAQDQGRHFKRCMDLVNLVRMKGLLRPRIEADSLAQAREIQAAIRQDLA